MNVVFVQATFVVEEKIMSRLLLYFSVLGRGWMEPMKLLVLRTSSVGGWVGGCSGRYLKNGGLASFLLAVRPLNFARASVLSFRVLLRASFPGPLLLTKCEDNRENLSPLTLDSTMLPLELSTLCLSLLPETKDLLTIFLAGVI